MYSFKGISLNPINLLRIISFLKIYNKLGADILFRRKLRGNVTQSFSYQAMVPMQLKLLNKPTYSPGIGQDAIIDIPDILLFHPVNKCHPLHDKKRDNGRNPDDHPVQPSTRKFPFKRDLFDHLECEITSPGLSGLNSLNLLMATALPGPLVFAGKEINLYGNHDATNLHIS